MNDKFLGSHFFRVVRFHATILCVLATLASCGKKPVNPARLPDTTGMSDLDGCYKYGAQKDHLFDKIDKALERAKKARGVQSEYEYDIFGNDSAPLLPPGMDQTVFNPQKFNGRIVRDEFKKLFGEVAQSEFGKRLLFTQESYQTIFRDMDGFHVRDMTNYVQRLRGIKELALEWRESVCNLDELEQKASLDVRPFVILNQKRCRSFHENFPEMPCAQRVVRNWRNSESRDGNEKEIERDFAWVCRRVRGPGECGSFWKNYEDRPEERVEYYDAVMRDFEARVYQKYFSPINVNDKFDCHWNGREATMIIPISMESIPGDQKSELRQIVEDAFHEYWNREGILNVMLRWVSTRTSREVVSVNLGSHRSHVSQTDPFRIHINRGLLTRRDALKRELAHEIGHVFGLNDCYARFYDSSEEAMIYYELDFNNLMCSTKSFASIPDESLETVRLHKCR